MGSHLFPMSKRSGTAEGIQRSHQHGTPCCAVDGGAAGSTEGSNNQSGNPEGIHPRKLTWNLKMMVSNRNLLFQGFIFRFHVSFPGCIPQIQRSLRNQPYYGKNDGGFSQLYNSLPAILLGKRLRWRDGLGVH